MPRKLLNSALTFALLVTLPSAVGAQTPQAPPERFEVASVKLVPSDRPNCSASLSGCYSSTPWGGAGYTATNVSMSALIEMAFGVTDNQLVGADRLGDQLYDVSAKPENGSLTYQRAQPMFRALLEERFKLTTHHETKEVPGYALVVANGGPKLKESKETGARSGFILAGRLLNPHASLPELAFLLTHPLGRPVVDKTGIQGIFDIDLKFAPEGTEPTTTGPSLPSIFTAVQEQLGLKLDSRKVPLEMLVIDHCERLPSEN